MTRPAAPSGVFVYVISSSPGDYFAEMAAVSMASLKLTNPQARIAAAVDADSCRDLTPGLREIRRLADLWLECDAPFEGGVDRSRYLKVNLRSLIEGDLVYLDSDTFILGDLSPLWAAEGDIAAVHDLDPAGNSYIMSAQHKANYDKMGWPRLEAAHLNTGVLLLRDRPAVHAFARQWQEDWRAYRDMVGKPNDQPVFNHTLQVMRPDLAILPTRYNAQIISNPMVARSAQVVHVFSGRFAERSDTVLHLATKALKNEGVLDLDLLREAIRRGHVWTRLDVVKKCLAAGDYPRALFIGLAKLARRAMGRRKI